MSETVRRYLAGNNVYRGGSNVATTGTVNPAGYISREQNKPERRSGIAAASLRILGKMKAENTQNQESQFMPKQLTETSGIYKDATGRSYWR